MMNFSWRMFYVVFDLIDQSQLDYLFNYEGKPITIFDGIKNILLSTLENSEIGNFDVKRTVSHFLIQ